MPVDFALDELPKAIVVPHAGYVYSGAIAASGYERVRGRRGTVQRIVLAGPSHRVPFDGVAVPSVDALETPRGKWTDPVRDATVLLIGRGAGYAALSVALGERMGLVGALSIEAAAKHLNSRDIDAIVLGDAPLARSQVVPRRTPNRQMFLHHHRDAMQCAGRLACA